MIQIGTRTVLAMTCAGCGQLRQGAEFDRYPRKPDERAYYDKRCRPVCRWRHKERDPQPLPMEAG